MTKPKGAVKNLDPVHTKEEARRRGANGGKKSGESKRRKKEARESAKLILELAAKGNIKANLKELGVEPTDQTNMMAMFARLYALAMSGNLAAFDKLMKYAGFDPEMNQRLKESDSRIEHMKDGGMLYPPTANEGGLDDDDEEKTDVVIYLPDNGRDKQ